MPDADESSPEESHRDAGAPATRVSPHFWVPSTYFAEGYPYAIVNNLAEILFQQAGAGLGLIGLTSLLHAPWNLKFLWAPSVDSIASKRRWMIAAQVAGAILLFCLAGLPIEAAALPWLAAAFLALAVASATNDIAIDAYYMEALDDAAQAKFVGYRATAYKLATLLVKGPLLGLVGVVGFALGFAAMGAVLLVVALAHLWLLPETPHVGRSVFSVVRTALTSRKSAFIALALVTLGLAWKPLSKVGHWLLLGPLPLSFWVAVVLVLALGAVWLMGTKRRSDGDRPAFAALMTTPRIGLALAFVVFFRTGESFLQKMKWPFLHQGLGVTVGEYAVVNGTFGALASFVGTFVGGYLIARSGLRRWFWWFILAQNLPNLAYVALAGFAQVGLAQAGVAGASGDWNVLVGVVVCIEELGSGFGTAVLMVYLMRLCMREHRATHFAVLTAIMSLSFTFAGAASGFIAQALGYESYFAFTFVATLPMMVLGWFAPGVRGEVRS